MVKNGEMMVKCWKHEDEGGKTSNVCMMMVFSD